MSYATLHSTGSPASSNSAIYSGRTRDFWGRAYLSCWTGTVTLPQASSVFTNGSSTGRSMCWTLLRHLSSTTTFQSSVLERLTFAHYIDFSAFMQKASMSMSIATFKFPSFSWKTTVRPLLKHESSKTKYRNEMHGLVLVHLSNATLFPSTGEDANLLFMATEKQINKAPLSFSCHAHCFNHFCKNFLAANHYLQDLFRVSGPSIAQIPFSLMLFSISQWHIHHKPAWYKATQLLSSTSTSCTSSLTMQMTSEKAAMEEEEWSPPGKGPLTRLLCFPFHDPVFPPPIPSSILKSLPYSADVSAVLPSRLIRSNKDNEATVIPRLSDDLRGQPPLLFVVPSLFLPTPLLVVIKTSSALKCSERAPGGKQRGPFEDNVRDAFPGDFYCLEECLLETLSATK